jgi:hypothetical protein
LDKEECKSVFGERRDIYVHTSPIFFADCQCDRLSGHDLIGQTIWNLLRVCDFHRFCLRRDRELHHQLQMDIQIQRMQETACNGKIPAGLDRQYLTEYLGDLLHDGNDQQESLGPGNPETLYRRLVRLFQDSSLTACRISLEL